MRSRACSVAAVIAIFLTGCEGGQTGDSGDGGGTDGDGCNFRRQPVAFDEVTPMGYTAQDLVSLVEGPQVFPSYLMVPLPAEAP